MYNNMSYEPWKFMSAEKCPKCGSTNVRDYSEIKNVEIGRNTVPKVYDLAICNSCKYKGTKREFIPSKPCPRCKFGFVYGSKSDVCEKCEEEIKKLEYDRKHF
ncbi:MAG: hypothetical protein ACTSPG_02905, partial [Candidatus Hodarchaeales archaeon]